MDAQVSQMVGAQRHRAKYGTPELPSTVIALGSEITGSELSN